MDRHEERTGVLPQGSQRGNSCAETRHVHLSAGWAPAAASARRGSKHRGHRRAPEGALHRRGPRRRVPAGHTRANPPLRRTSRPRGRLLARRRGPRDAVGFRLGARSVRDPAGNWCGRCGSGNRRGTAGSGRHPEGRAPREHDLGNAPRRGRSGTHPFGWRIDAEAGQGQQRRSAAQLWREPRGPRRRRARGRIPHQVEHHRWRHHRDAGCRRQRSGGQFPGARRRQRRHKLFGRREPHAPAARSAGGQLG